MSKQTRRKAVYPNAKKFTNEELWRIISKFRESNPEQYPEAPTEEDKKKKSKIEIKSWMSFDMKNESPSENMKKNKVRYLKVLVTDLEGKVRPLKRQTVGAQTKSRAKLGEVDSGLPGSAKFQTRIETLDDAKLADMAREKVAEKYPDISQEELKEKAAKQEKILQKQLLQWRVEKAINDEFERILNDRDYRMTINFNKGKNDTVGGNVQYGRKPREDSPDDQKLVDPETDMIPLDQPIVHKTIKIDKGDGSLWCRVYDKSAEANGKRVLATFKDPKTKQKMPLSYKTIEAWLRYGSVFTGVVSYDLCISGRGARLHEKVDEMDVRRAAKSEGKSQIDEEESNALDDFEGDFAQGSDEEDEVETKEDAEVEKPKDKKDKKKSTKPKHSDTEDIYSSDDGDEVDKDADARLKSLIKKTNTLKDKKAKKDDESEASDSGDDD